MNRLLLIIISVLISLCSLGQKKVYETTKVNPVPPVIDGLFTDETWQIVEWGGDFIQYEPYANQAPSVQTAFKILYDDRYIYIAYRCFDSEPDKIDCRMSRRDGFAGDWVEINIDSYFDKRTAFSFTITAGGVKGDEMITEDGNFDSDWDPIWYAKTAIDSSGWTAEVKIPLSQLRYSNNEHQIWGIQFTRRFFRKDERSLWQIKTRESSGWVRHFGELHGIKGIKPQKQIEISPYTTVKSESYKKEEGNPFATGNDESIDIGVDGKIGITSDLTLDFTINPDFGQVEADPSEVNLTAFETYFQEKRPFFIEGRNILNFGITSGDGPLSGDNLFYSRRIGREPQYTPDTEDDEYVKIPENTKILGAFKLTGKTRKGLSIGILESITSKEYGKIGNENESHKIIAEPFANYFVARLRQDLQKGNTVFGGMFTSTNRDLAGSEIDFLHQAAYTGGLDFLQYFKNRSYYLKVKSVFSHVSGDRSAISETQQNSRHYFQRPDASHYSLDTNRTQLSGYGGSIDFAKMQGKVKFLSWLTWRSPGLELNDVGFLRRTDEIQQIIWVQYNIFEPFSIFNSFSINFNQWKAWEFTGKTLYDGGNTNLHFRFKNFWRLGAGYGIEANGISNQVLRGGPSMRYTGNQNTWINFGTDHRKKLIFDMGTSRVFGLDNNIDEEEYWGGITIRPGNALDFAVYPSYSNSHRILQYIEEIEYTNESRYLFGAINQETMVFEVRINYSIKPDLSIQYYGQPFISKGEYSEIKYISDPHAKRITDRFHVFEGNEIFLDPETNIYSFDEDGNGTEDYTIENPDFDFLQFRSNLVIRWEYIPGSTFFLVWSQNRTESPDTTPFHFRKDFNNLFRVYPHNVFLIKFTYCFKL